MIEGTAKHIYESIPKTNQVMLRNVHQMTPGGIAFMEIFNSPYDCLEHIRQLSDAMKETWPAEVAVRKENMSNGVSLEFSITTPVVKEKKKEVEVEPEPVVESPAEDLISADADVLAFLNDIPEAPGVVYEKIEPEQGLFDFMEEVHETPEISETAELIALRAELEEWKALDRTAEIVNIESVNALDKALTPSLEQIEFPIQ